MGYWDEMNDLSRGWTDTESAPSTPQSQPRRKRKRSPSPKASPGSRADHDQTLAPEPGSSGKGIPTYIIPESKDGRFFSVHYTNDLNPRVDAKAVRVEPIPYPVPLSPGLEEGWDRYVEAQDGVADIRDMSAYDVEADCDYHVCHSPSYTKSKRLRLEIDDGGRALEEHFASQEGSGHRVPGSVDSPSVRQKSQIRRNRRRLEAELSGYELRKRVGDKCRVKNPVDKVLHKRSFGGTKHLENPFVTTPLAEAEQDQEETEPGRDALDAGFDDNGVGVEAWFLDPGEKDEVDAAGEGSSDDHEPI